MTDAAHLYCLALEHHAAGLKYHAVGEEGIEVREIAEAVGSGLGVPVRSISQDEADDYFGFLALFASADMPASSAWTRERFGWTPKGPGLIADLGGMDFAAIA